VSPRVPRRSDIRNSRRRPPGLFAQQLHRGWDEEDADDGGVDDDGDGQPHSELLDGKYFTSGKAGEHDDDERRSIGDDQQPVSDCAVAHAVRRVGGWGRAGFVVDNHERATGKSADHVDRGYRRHLECLQDELDRRQGSASREGRECPQTTLIIGEQQFVAPPNRGLSERRRSGFRLVGSLNTTNRSSWRRVISSTDNVLVRAAANSITNGL
jgi:hypothetical protein